MDWTYRTLPLQKTVTKVLKWGQLQKIWQSYLSQITLIGKKCLNNTGGKKSKKEDFLVKGTRTYSSAPERSLLLAALHLWAATSTGLTMAYTCTFDLSLYSRFSQMFPHIPFKFSLHLRQFLTSNMVYCKWKSCMSFLVIGCFKFGDFLDKEPVTLKYCIIFLQKFQNEHWQATSQKVLAKQFW